MKAKLKQYRQAPRKMRLLADLVRGKRVDVALTELAHSPKRGAEVLAKLIQSALANASSGDATVSSSDLFVHRITVDEGFTIKRFMPRAFGRATPINKRTSHINVVLAPLEQRKTQNTNHKTQTEEKANKAPLEAKS